MRTVGESDTPLQKLLVTVQREDGLVRRAIKLARYLFMPLAVVFILYAVWSARDLLGVVLEGANYVWVVVSLAVWTTLHFVVPLFDRAILHELNAGVPYSTLRRIYFTRLPTKYLPGGIWHNVTRLIDLNRAEVPRHQLTTLAVLQISIPASVAFIVGGIVVATTQSSSRWALIGAFAAASASIVLIATPYVLNRSALRNQANLRIPGYVTGVAVTTIFWVAAASAFYIYLAAYSIFPDGTSPLDVGGAYLMAWGTGFISIFTPQGFGVFEATAATLVPTITEFQVMVAIVAGFRIVVLASDVAAWLASRTWHHFKGERDSHHATH